MRAGGGLTTRERNIHVPVLLDEVIDLLAPAPGEHVLDLTVGAGGHAQALVERIGPTGFLVGVDRDREILEVASARLAGRPVRLVQGSFAALAELALPLRAYHAILLDLGVSSWQLDEARRGFSFQREGPLDMRMDASVGQSLGEQLERWDVEELTRIIREFGEERHARRVAEALLAHVRGGGARTTVALAAAVRAVLPPRRGERIDPATRTFQALRIAVNRELEQLAAFLARFDPWLHPGGRLAIIAYHSLEDRLVKDAFRQRVREGSHRLLTRQPVRPTDVEMARNPRARSARLRALARRERAA